MTFDDNSMDTAQKALETTRKFCTTHNKKFGFFSSSSTTDLDKLSLHERLNRRCIAADCLLFEAIIVFLKQGITSYVKGGYLLRKAWKTYEKVYQEMEHLCPSPSPISKQGTLSPTDKHVGTSVYDKKLDTRDVINDTEEGLEGVDENLTSLDVGFASSETSLTEKEKTCKDQPPPPSDTGYTEEGNRASREAKTANLSSLLVTNSCKSGANGFTGRSSISQPHESSSEQVCYSLSVDMACQWTWCPFMYIGAVIACLHSAVL